MLAQAPVDDDEVLVSEASTTPEAHGDGDEEADPQEQLKTGIDKILSVAAMVAARRTLRQGTDVRADALGKLLRGKSSDHIVEYLVRTWRMTEVPASALGPLLSHKLRRKQPDEQILELLVGAESLPPGLFLDERVEEEAREELVKVLDNGAHPSDWVVGSLYRRLRALHLQNPS